MGNKRTRNRIPALPEAVKNLLALHSLEAWPAKERMYNRGALIWAWKVINAGEDHLTARAAFTMTGSCDLDKWMAAIKRYTEGDLWLDFETSNRYWQSADFSSHMIQIERDLAIIKRLTKFP